MPPQPVIAIAAQGFPSTAGLLVLSLTSALLLSLLAYYMRTGAPPVPARAGEAAQVVALLERASLGPTPRVYDLGCGWGSLAVHLARALPGAEIIGLELSPLPWAVAKLRSLWHQNLTVRRADFQRFDLRDADAVTAYLMIRPMPPLARQLDRQLRPGTPVVTLTFWFRDRVPTAHRRGMGAWNGSAALYRWPGKHQNHFARTRL